MTVPVLLALHVAVGASAVVAGRRKVLSGGALSCPVLWALLLFEVVLAFPVGAYLLWRYPDWSLMYLTETGGLDVPDWTLATTYVLAALVAYFIARHILLKGQFWAGVGFCGGFVLLAAAVGGFGVRQLTTVGNTAAFRAESPTLMPLGDTPLFYLLPVAAGALLVSWGITLWRLSRLGQAVALREEQVAATMIRLDATSPPEELKVVPKKLDKKNGKSSKRKT